MTISYEPLGFLESVFREKFGTPRQPGLVPESTAKLKLRGDINPSEALKGLEEFSHVWIIFHFHKNANKEFNAKIYPPRMGGEKIGVFATRSPHRVNSLGISCAKLDRVEGDTIYLSGIDIIDGTPILDIKPYIPWADSRPEATNGWIARAEPLHLDVTFSEESLEQIRSFNSEPKLKALIENILVNDPRNPMDKEDSRQNKVLGFFIGEYNVIFSVEGSKAKVLKVETRNDFDSRNSKMDA